MHEWVPASMGQSSVFEDASPHSTYQTGADSLFKDHRALAQILRDSTPQIHVAPPEARLSETEVAIGPRLPIGAPAAAPEGRPQPDPVSVMVVDSQTLFRSGLARLLSEDDLISVEMVSEGTQNLPELCAAMSIDVVITDIDVKGWDGIELIRMISRTSPNTRVIVLATKADWNVVPAISAGAAGFLLKNAEPEAIRSAVLSAHRGERILCAEASRWLGFDGSIYGLTRRDKDILRLVATGANNREIADLLRLGDKTVRNYVSRLYRKLAVNGRGQLSLSAGHPLLSDVQAGDGVARQADCNGHGVVEG